MGALPPSDRAIARELMWSQLEKARELALQNLEGPLKRLMVRGIDVMTFLIREIGEPPEVPDQGSKPGARRMAELDESCRRPEDPSEEIKLRMMMAYLILAVWKVGPSLFHNPEEISEMKELFVQLGAKAAFPELLGEEERAESSAG